MTRTVILPARVERDIRGIREWYESQQLGLGEAFLRRLRETLELVRLRPESAPLIYKTVRRAIVSKFPYVVFYVAESTRVVVLAVLHSSRDPATWPRR
jgi:plasmid stabilization system protein ParE